MNAPLANSAGNGRSGATYTLSSWVNGDGNTFSTQKWLDGAAGTAWRIQTNTAQTVGGTADGMVVFDHYVVALNNSSGGLGGYRWLGCFRIPFYNQSGAANNAPGTYIFLAPPSTSSPTSGVNWSIQPGGSGPVTTTPMVWLGSDGNTLDVINFSCAGSTSACVVTSGGGAWNWNVNQTTGGQPSNFLPVLITNVPTSQGTQQGITIQSGNGAFIYLDSGSPNSTFEFYNSAQAAQEFFFTGAFTGTLTPAPCIATFQRVFIANKDSQYWFFQGTGSLSSDGTQTFVKINQTYWQSAAVTAPFNLSYNGTNNGGTLTDYGYSGAYYPYSVGNMPTYEPGTGDHPDIGILNLFQISWFYNTSWISLRHSRIIGLSGGFASVDFIDPTAKTRLDFSGAGTYGLAAPANSSISYSLSFYGSGTGFPNVPCTGFAYALSGGEHEPDFATMAYLQSGEMQFLDIMIDQMYGDVIGGSPSFRQANAAGQAISSWSGNPSGTYAPCSNTNNSEMRAIGWFIRMPQWVAHLYPTDLSASSSNPLFTDGTSMSAYALNSANAAVGWINDQVSHGTVPWTTFFSTNSLWLPYFAYGVGGQGTPGWGTNGAVWEYFTVLMAMCLGAARQGTATATQDPGAAAAKAFITTCGYGTFGVALSQLGNWVYITDGGPYGYCFDSQVDTGTGNYIHGLISSATDYTSPPYPVFAPNGAGGSNYITWDFTTSPSFTFHTGGSFPAYTPQNGDIYRPGTNVPGGGGGVQIIPTELSGANIYYAVNTTTISGGYKFDLSLTMGGSPVTGSSSSGSNNLGFTARPVQKQAVGCAAEGGDSYICQYWLVCAWACALGLTGFGTAADSSGFVTTTPIGDANYRLTNSTAGAQAGGTFTQGFGIDYRYIAQPSFA